METHRRANKRNRNFRDILTTTKNNNSNSSNLNTLSPVTAPRYCQLSAAAIAQGSRRVSFRRFSVAALAGIITLHGQSVTSRKTLPPPPDLITLRRYYLKTPPRATTLPPLEPTRPFQRHHPSWLTSYVNTYVGVYSPQHHTHQDTRKNVNHMYIHIRKMSCTKLGGGGGGRKPRQHGPPASLNLTTVTRPSLSPLPWGGLAHLPSR